MQYECIINSNMQTGSKASNRKKSDVTAIDVAPYVVRYTIIKWQNILRMSKGGLPYARTFGTLGKNFWRVIFVL